MLKGIMKYLEQKGLLLPIKKPTMQKLVFRYLEGITLFKEVETGYSPNHLPESTLFKPMTKYF
jgi:hypothetical protein